ncbi:MAG: class I SAM-dependent methyltransferase [Candidatus Cloacimonetes bacterium]|nr:class I SAM-dependent methyltransferase [Candidatus Cloacimonadota bacterium]
MKRLSDWENNKGINFLKKAGIKEDYKVLDFGCNNGNYSIPASKIVGENGRVYAIDNNSYALEILKEKAKLLPYKNIKTVNNNGNLNINLKSNYIDFVLLYDILHYLKLENRKTLYQEIYRVLKPNSILSVYPKHIIGNMPLMEFTDISLRELINEIENNGFEFIIKICSVLSHDEHLEEGCIINLRKRE